MPICKPNNFTKHVQKQTNSMHYRDHHRAIKPKLNHYIICNILALVSNSTNEKNGLPSVIRGNILDVFHMVLYTASANYLFP